MKLFFSVAFLSFLSMAAMAQNWSPINTQETFYYHSGGEEPTGIRIDSVAVVEGDTVWYTNLMVDFHPELGVNPAWCSEFDTEVVVIMDAGFMQSEILSLGAGVLKFQNPDTFEIHTQAIEGSEWVYSQLYGEEEVVATVTDVATAEVLGQLDSVKFISLSDGRNIVLSKNHGLVEFESTGGDTYEIGGIADRQLGEYPIGRHEIFDFSPGDVFVYLSGEGNSEQGFSKSLIRVEIEAVVVNGDNVEIQHSSVVYRRNWELVQVGANHITVETDPQRFNATGLTYSMPVSGHHISDIPPNSVFLKPIDEAVINPFFTVFFGWNATLNLYVFIDDINGRITKSFGGTSALSESVITCAEQFDELGLGCPDQSETVYQFFDVSTGFFGQEIPILLNDTALFIQGGIYCLDTYQYFAFGEGLGIIGYQYSDGLSDDSQVMVGYRKGDEEFGYIPTASEILSVGDGANATLPSVSVYPVPTADELFLTSHQAESFRIFDISGKPVLYGVLKGDSGIDVSTLAAGIYNGHLLRNEQPTGQFRFVKQ